MSAVEIVAFYVMGCCVTAYICGRVGEDFLAFTPVVLWPIFALYAPFWLLFKLGERHR